MRNKKDLATYFIFVLLAVSFYFAYLVFSPFLAILLLSAIFVTLLYPVYAWLLKHLNGQETVAALLAVAAFVLIILIPLGNLLLLLAKESSDTYALMQQRLVVGDLSKSANQLLMQLQQFHDAYLPFIKLQNSDITQFFLDLSNRFNTFILSSAAVLIKGTTQLITSLFFLLLTMYYLLKDGKKFLLRLAQLTPIPNRYDHKIFERFQQISKSAILGSLLTALAQGLVSALGYMIVGAPALFLGVATAFAGLVPVIGTTLVWIPTIVVYLLMGQWVQALFLFLWGLIVVSLVDNVVRTYVIKGKADIHPLLIFFSILGGVSVFGFFGIFFGPMALAIMLTVLNIYELEFASILER